MILVNGSHYVRRSHLQPWWTPFQDENPSISSSMYSEREVFAGGWRKFVGMFEPGYNTVDLLFAKIRQAPGKAYSVHGTEEYKLNRQVTMLVYRSSRDHMLNLIE